MATETIIPISAIEHFVYCPRQCALIHVDGVWTDNVHTARGKYEHRRVDGGGHRTERGSLVLRSIPLWSEVLGLSGRADTIEINGGVVFPVEFKSGSRHGLTADMQLCAQALCLEEMFNLSIKKGAIFYSGNRRRVSVEFTVDLRDKVLLAIAEIRRQIELGSLPEAPNDRRCSQCQLLNHCIPELTAQPHEIINYVNGVVMA